MRPKQDVVSQQGSHALFFVFLAAGSLAISLGSFASGQSGSALLWMPLVFAFGFVAWKRLSRPRAGGGSPGQTDAGRPVPVKPGPTHHLVAASALPPADKTRSFPKD
jgi:hypothetical protein